MEIFLIVATSMLITVFIADTSQKRNAYLCQQVESAKRQPTIRK
ncbi:MAG: hypothetical protein U0X92_09055 [Anaerolineales bacterium]